MEKSYLRQNLFEIQRVEWFYMTKQLYYKMPLASLERHQMYKDDLFLDFNCLIIPAAPKRFCCIKLISLWQSQCYSTLVWAIFSWHSHQASHSSEQKNTEDGEEYVFHQGMINWYKWLKQREIMKWIWKEASQEKLCLFQAYFNELFITGQEKLLRVFFCWSPLCKIIMACWSEKEEEVEGSESCGGGEGLETRRGEGEMFLHKLIIFFLHWDLSVLWQFLSSCIIKQTR